MPAASDETALARLRAMLAGDEAGRIADAEARLAALEARLAAGELGGRGVFAQSLRRRPWPWAIAAVAAMAAIGLLSDGPISRARKTAEIETALRAAQASDARLAPYPIEVDEDWANQTATLRGLAPSREALGALVAALTPAAAPLTLLPRVEIAASGDAIRGVADRLTGLDGALKLLSSRLDTGEARAAAAEGSAAAGRAAVAQKFDATTQALAAARDELAQFGETLRAVSEAGKVHGDEILTLAAGLDRLRVKADPAAPAAPTPAAQAEALRLAAAGAEPALAAAAAQAQSVMDKAGEARANAGADPTLAAALEAVKEGAAKTEAMLRTEIEAARRRADMANALAKSLAANGDAATVGELAKGSRIAFADDDSFADPEAATALIDRLAQALQRGGQSLRVIGLATSDASRDIAAAHAAEVSRLLAARGAPAPLLETAVRDAGPDEPPGVAFEAK